MSNIEYIFCSDETEIIERINSLLDLFKVETPLEQDLYIEDFYFFSAIDKSLKLIDSFLFALEKRNVTVLAALTRIQMDCVLRTYATTLVSDSTSFCEKILLENKPINKEKDVNNHALSDKYLCETLGNVLNLPLYDLYQKVCGYIHFSSSSFYNSVKAEKDNVITMNISKANRDDRLNTYERLSIELANHFYYFGKILITFIYRSWQTNKKSFNNQ